MNVFTGYDVTTGRILAIFSLPESQTDPGPPMAGQAYYPGKFAPEDFYFNGEEMAARLESGITLSVVGPHTFEIAEVPLGAEVTVRGEGALDQFDSDEIDGVIEYSVNEDGLYEVQVKSFPLKDFSATVTFP